MTKSVVSFYTSCDSQQTFWSVAAAKTQVELMTLIMALFHLCVPVSQQAKGTQPSLIKVINHTCACLPGWSVTAGVINNHYGRIPFRVGVRFLLSIAYCTVLSKEEQQLHGEDTEKGSSLLSWFQSSSQSTADWLKHLQPGHFLL